MSTPVRASDRDLRALAAIVSQDRPDLPDGEGLPPSLLADLMGQIRCDLLSLDSWDSGRQMCWFSQNIPSGDAAIDSSPRVHRSGVLGELLGLPALQLRCPHRRPAQRHQGRGLLLGPAMAQHRHVHRSRPAAGPGALSHGVPAQRAAANRRARAVCAADPYPRARAGLLRAGPGGAHAAGPAPGPGLPGRRSGAVTRSPGSPPGRRDLLRLLAAGHTNTQIARRLGISEGTVRTHLENIYERLHVSSRTAAVTRAFPDRAA